jgi:hypothetical protein
MPTKPPPPSPENERALIEWLLRYGRDFEIVRKIYAPNLARAVQIFADEAEKELREHNSHEALRARNDLIHRLFNEGFLPGLNNQVHNILFLEPVQQGRVMQVFVKASLLDYFLLYKYKDKREIAMSMANCGLEELYEQDDLRDISRLDKTEKLTAQLQQHSRWKW